LRFYFFSFTHPSPPHIYTLSLHDALPISELQSLIDDDVAEGMGALAATFETASRGLIYDHRPASLPAERLTAALKPMLADAGRSTGTAFDRDAAVVLRRIETAARDIRAINREDRRAFL